MKTTPSLLGGSHFILNEYLTSTSSKIIYKLLIVFDKNLEIINLRHKNTIIWCVISLRIVWSFDTARAFLMRMRVHD